MSNDDVQLDYDYLTQQALRYLVRDVLKLVADLGDAPGEHHFYIEFKTRGAGATVPDHLLADYPEVMTIVLQHQFDDLDVDDDGFAVTLWFKGREARLEIPFAAVTSFADPSVQFGLRFEAGETADDDAAPATKGARVSDESAAPPPIAGRPQKDSQGKPSSRKKGDGEAAGADGDKRGGEDPDAEKSDVAGGGDGDGDSDGDSEGADIVSLDAFRKK